MYNRLSVKKENLFVEHQLSFLNKKRTNFENKINVQNF